MLVGAALASGGYALAGTPVVTITPSGPTPLASTVPWGGTVRFTNADTVAHTLRVSGSPDGTATIAAGASYSAVFSGRKGTLRYTISGGHRRFRGSVSVGLSGQLTLSADRSSVVYGEKLSLRGRSTLGRMPVTIQMEPLEQARAQGKKAVWRDVADVKPSASGSFVVSVAPTVGARYRATTAATQLRSADVHVRVTPSVQETISPRSSVVGGVVVALARVVPAAAAERAVLTRFVPARKAWVAVAHGAVSGGRVRIPWHVDRAGRQELRVELAGGAGGFVAASGAPVMLDVAWPPTVLSLQTVPVAGAPNRPRFAPQQLSAHPGRITVAMQNLDSARHSIAIRGEGVDVRGRVVGHGGVSRVTADLQAGKYTLYSAADGRRSALVGTLIVH